MKADMIHTIHNSNGISVRILNFKAPNTFYLSKIIKIASCSIIIRPVKFVMYFCYYKLQMMRIGMIFAHTRTSRHRAKKPQAYTFVASRPRNAWGSPVPAIPQQSD